MKKSLSTLLLIAAAAMAVSSCNKEELNNGSQNENNGSSYTVNIQAGSVETKSQFGTPDGTHYPVLWTDDVDACFSLDGAYPVASTPVPSTDQKESAFSVKFSTTPKENGGTIYGFSPKGYFKSGEPEKTQAGFSSIQKSYGYAYLVIPSEQKPLATSVDPSAQALYGSVAYDESGIPDPVKIVFDHAVAYGKMTITNYSSDYKSVSIKFPSAVAGTGCKYYIADYESFVAGNIYDADVKTINIDPTNAQGNVIWFAIAPTGTITSGNIVVEIENAQGHKYTKTIILSSQKSIAFNAGEISKFTVNMNGIQPASEEWTLVTDASTLKAGDQLVIASNENGKTAGAISSGYMAAVNSTFSADKSTITTLGESTVVLTLGGEKDAWTLSSGSNILGVASAKVSWNGTDATNTWSISISDNNATISSTNYGSNGRFLYNVNSPRFKPYTSSTTTSMLLPQLYKKSSGTIDTRTPRNLAYSSKEATAVIGAAFSAPALSGITEGGVSYTSSNGSVATIDANGKVTILSAGTTTITATAAANETYQEGVAAYILTVVAPKVTGVEGVTTWAWNSTESQTLTVQGSNLHGITIDDSDLENFELICEGYEILVNPKGINESEADYEESFKVSAADGNTYTVYLKQTKKPIEGADVTITTNISAWLSANSSVIVSSGSDIGSKVSSIELDSNITISVTGTGNTGTFWGTAPANDWRLYSKNGDEATVTITAKNSKKIKSIKFSFSTSNGGGLKYGNTSLKSNTSQTIETNDSTVSLSVPYSSGKTGQARITEIVVTYN